MAERLRWWVIPGALIVLARVVTLGDGSVPAPGKSTAAEDLPAIVSVQDATGHRRGPVALAAAASKALVVDVPRHAGQRVELTLWRRVDDKREAAPWLTMRPAVRGDGTIPIVGLAAGTYDVDLVFGGPDWERCHADGVAVPGRLVLAEPGPGR